MLKGRSRGIVFASVLFALALILGIVTSGFATIFVSLASPKAASSTPTSEFGTLLVTSFLNKSLSAPTPIANASVLVSPVNRFPFLPVHDHTRSDGRVTETLFVGAYTVTVSDPRFLISDRVTIYPSEVTELDVTVNQSALPSLYSVLPGGVPPGSTAPWQELTVALPTPPAKVSQGDSVFIDAVYAGYFGLLSGGVSNVNGSTSFLISGQNAEVKATVVSSETRSYLGATFVWATLRPSGFIPTSGLTQLVIVRYIPQSRVTIHGG